MKGMDKKKILFVIHRLDAGGAEKSLISLLNSLPLNFFEIDLLAVDPKGIFRNQVPATINIVKAPRELVGQNAPITQKRFWENVTFKILCVKIYCIICNHFRGEKSKKGMCHSQYYNKIWRHYVPENPKEYDVAVSYIDGMNYYVMDHVKAKKKILWCHNDYDKLDLIPEYDLPYYEKADKICTISELCRKSLIENFPSLYSKIDVIENILSPRMINEQANSLEEIKLIGDGFLDEKRFKIVSIGRLAEQKGFDFAVSSAKILLNKGLGFCWYILGDGELRGQLEESVRKEGVSDVMKFVGIRSNPYPYIKNSDLYVMPSRYEGKSIALDEAKILCKPIVVTNYPSVGDAIINGKNGLIVDINAQAIADGIMELYNNRNLRETFVRNLELEDCSNEKQVVEEFLKLLK